MNSDPLPNDQFAEVAILGDQDAALVNGGRKPLIVGGSRVRRRDRGQVEAGAAKPLDDETRNVLVRQKARHSAARTVSCCR